jgi:phenylpropionate dioxygenase-like ring-hydroxylating dioxygenase large terminal subunit
MFRGNWKLQIENVLDSYHVPFGHASTVAKDGKQFARREGDKEGAKVHDKSNIASDWKVRRSYDMGHGHGWTSNTMLDEGKRSSPAYDAYVKSLEDKVGKERAAQILRPRLHNSLIYPNMSIMGLNIHVRVIKPIAVDLTEVNVFPIRLVGAPDSMNFGNIRLLNVTHSAASFVQTDDAEAFVRTQNGLQSQLTEWVDISRGLGTEDHDNDYNAPRAKATDEMVMRGQYRAWLDYMREAA